MVYLGGEVGPLPSLQWRPHRHQRQAAPGVKFIMSVDVQSIGSSNEETQKERTTNMVFMK